MENGDTLNHFYSQCQIKDTLPVMPGLLSSNRGNRIEMFQILSHPISAEEAEATEEQNHL